MADIQDTPQTPEVTPPQSEAQTDVEQISTESMVKVIDEKLKKLERSDFLSINVSKTGAYVALGLIAVVLWLMPIINFGINKISNGMFTKETVEATPVPSPTPIEIIRVRLGSDSLTEAQDIEKRLNSLGFNQLEFWYDDQINSDSVMVVTKKENADLTNKIISVMEKDYIMASESAVLTEDSDVKATILIGKEAKK